MVAPFLRSSRWIVVASLFGGAHGSEYRSPRHVSSTPAEEVFSPAGALEISPPEADDVAAPTSVLQLPAKQQVSPLHLGSKAARAATPALLTNGTAYSGFRGSSSDEQRYTVSAVAGTPEASTSALQQQLSAQQTASSNDRLPATSTGRGRLVTSMETVDVERYRRQEEDDMRRIGANAAGEADPELDGGEEDGSSSIDARPIDDSLPDEDPFADPQVLADKVTVSVGSSPATAKLENVHKPFWPLNSDDLFAMLLCMLGLMIAACGGIGGGGFIVPIYLLIMKFSTKHAVALSNATIFGGSIANAMFNLGKKTDAGNPTIDWDIIWMMEPSTIAGALIGTYLQVLFPEIVLTTMLSIILAYMGRETLQKAWKRWSQEQEQLSSGGQVPVSVPGTSTDVSEDRSQQPGYNYRELSDAETKGATLDGPIPDGVARGDSKSTVGSLSNEAESSWLSTATPTTAADTSMTRHTSIDDDDPTVGAFAGRELQQPLTPPPQARGQGQPFSGYAKFKQFLPLYFGTLALVIAKGGGKFQPVVHCGTFGWWMLSLSTLPLCLFFMVYFRRLILSAPATSSSRSAVKWDKENTIRYPAICSLAGLFAGLFGVGGGIVKGPLMLAMGVEPKIASATAATMIFFTSSCACTSYIFFGELVFDYGIALFFLGFVCTVAGQILTTKCLSKNRQSPIVFSIAVVILLSSVAMAFESVTHGYTAWKQNKLWDTGSLCPVAAPEIANAMREMRTVADTLMKQAGKEVVVVR